ncbi:MAG: hypothetical protein NT091_01660 [Candidatus Falkowbacteria bacterium]|nr:hypothetical protein [Candidatus Falkowbacteria bacterium]
MSLFSQIFGDPNEKIIKSLDPIIAQINGLESHYVQLTREEIVKNIEKLMANFPKEADHKTKETYLNSILAEAFAMIREASKRTLGLRHFDVQLVGGIILHRGQIAEMKTGEGKTLVATLSLFLNALSNEGVHLVTVNDYLARVGAGWMAPVYHFRFSSQTF